MRARARARCIWPDEEALRLARQQVDLHREIPMDDDGVVHPGRQVCPGWC